MYIVTFGNWALWEVVIDGGIAIKRPLKLTCFCTNKFLFYTTFYLTCIFRVSQKFFRIDLIFCMDMCFGSLLSRMTKFF